MLEEVKDNTAFLLGNSVTNMFQVKDSFPPSCFHCDNGTSLILYSFACSESINLQGDCTCCTCFTHFWKHYDYVLSFQRNMQLEGWFPPVGDEITSEYMYVFNISLQYDWNFSICPIQDKSFVGTWCYHTWHHHPCPANPSGIHLLQEMPYLVKNFECQPEQQDS